MSLLARKGGMSTVLNNHAAHPEILATYTDAALHGKRGKDSIGEAQIDDAVVLIVELLPYLSVRWQDYAACASREGFEPPFCRRPRTASASSTRSIWRSGSCLRARRRWTRKRRPSAG